MIRSVDDCPVENGHSQVIGSVIYDGEVVGEFSTIGRRWRHRYTVPYEADAGTYSVEVTCFSRQEPSVTYDYETLTFTVTELPKDLGLTVNPEVARPGETVTWVPDEPCPNGGRAQDRVYYSMYYLGADGTSEPEYYFYGNPGRDRVDESGAWIMAHPAPADEGVYGMRLACVVIDATNQIPYLFEATYEWSYLTVSEEDGATPIRPTEPPPNEIPVVPEESPGAPGSTEASTSAAPPATPVIGEPSFTG